MLLALISALGRKWPSGFAEYEIVGHSPRLEMPGQSRDEFDELVILKRTTPFSGEPHFHSVARGVQKAIDQD